MVSMTRFGPTQRGGPVFRWLGEPLALDLANTVMVIREGEPIDLLASPEGVSPWLETERPRLGGGAIHADDLPRLCDLRDAVRELLTAVAEERAPRSEAIEHVNAASAGAPVAPQLVTARGGDLQRTEKVEEGGALTLALGALARSTISILTSPERDQLEICRAPSCGMFFLGKRRWCCAACGNRARAARHYRRVKGTVASPS